MLGLGYMHNSKRIKQSGKRHEFYNLIIKMIDCWRLYNHSFIKYTSKIVLYIQIDSIYNVLFLNLEEENLKENTTPTQCLWLDHKTTKR
jgi:hypothetical protein